MYPINRTKREQFERDGFFVLKDILESELIARLDRVSGTVLSEQEESHFKKHRSDGSMVMIDWEMAYQHSVLAELIAHPALLATLGQLGFAEPKFGHGRIISKPPHSPPLFWHEDGRFWNDPVSYTPQPIQVFLMVYLTDTTRENGCLRVIPGSHMKRHPLHYQVPCKHTDELRDYIDPNHIAYQRAEGEIDVPVKAGDVVMGYGNMFHSTHPNDTDDRRTMLTLWYYPDFVNLPDRTQATVEYLEAGTKAITTTAGPDHAAMEPLRIVYQGTAKPIEQEWTPGKNLK
jgi:ectoine hydroxylase-related dioxygenase (phytanoyl-CoA dioxygenase family)